MSEVEVTDGKEKITLLTTETREPSFGSKALSFIGSNIVSWVIEAGILIVIATATIGEVRKTNEQTREMLTAISQFASERQEAVGDAIDDLAFEASQVDIEGDVNIEDIGGAAKDLASEWLSRNEDDDE